MAKQARLIAFTYELTPEDSGFSVRCLDWDCVFSEGETVEECKKNVSQVTRMYLRELIAGTLDERDYPRFKAHRTSMYQFILVFNTETLRVFDPSERFKAFSKATAVGPTELLVTV
ncbi:MAG: hypothetical protein WAQ28_02105 [Bacteroidia bacterium]